MVIVVGDKVAMVNKYLCLIAEFRSFLDVIPEDHAGLDEGYAVLLLYHRALGSFAASVGSEDQNVHVSRLLFAGGNRKVKDFHGSRP